MVIKTNRFSEMNLVIKSCIGICVAVLFAQTIFVLSPINLALSIETPVEHQHENDNKEGATITGQQIQTISNIGNPSHQTSKTFAARTIPSSSSSFNNLTNLTSGKSAITKTSFENKVLNWR